MQLCLHTKQNCKAKRPTIIDYSKSIEVFRPITCSALKLSSSAQTEEDKGRPRKHLAGSNPSNKFTCSVFSLFSQVTCHVISLTARRGESDWAKTYIEPISWLKKRAYGAGFLGPVGLGWVLELVELLLVWLPWHIT